MNPKKIYIAGKITGLHTAVYTANFANAERMLQEKYPNALIVNPVVVCSYLPKNSTYQDYCLCSMKAMLECNFVYKLDNWQDSNGAKNEINQAEFFNLNILN